MSETHYHKGYVQGTFDLFHAGHLILLERAKKRCDILVVGVVSDELSEKYKNKRPVIPYADRAEIVRAIRYVDEVIRVDFENEDKLKIWDEIHYDCHFSGDDHTGWEYLESELKKRGAALEFFPYTQRVSSTSIVREIHG